MYAQLGEIKFRGLKGFQSFVRSREQEYAQHSRINGKPGLQRVGAKLDTVQIDIRFHAAFCRPDEEINKLQTALDDGEALPFILGNGAFLGDFVVEKIEEDTVKSDPDGNIIDAALSIDILERFERDKKQADRVTAKNNAFAYERNNPVAQNFTPTFSAGKLAAENLKITGTEAGAINDEVEEAESFPSRRDKLFNKVQSRLQKVSDNLNDFKARINEAKQNYRNAQRMIDRADDALTQVSELDDAILSGDINEVVNTNEALQGSTNDLDNASAAFAGQVAARNV